MTIVYFLTVNCPTQYNYAIMYVVLYSKMPPIHGKHGWDTTLLIRNFLHSEILKKLYQR